MSFTSPESTPAWTAAPSATTSSGLTPLCGSLPKNSFTCFCTIGMRVEPPTSTTSSMSDGFLPASASAFLVGSMARSTRSPIICSSFARDSLICRCLGPAGVGGEERQVDLRLHGTDDSSIFAFSAASLRRWRTILSLETSMPWSFLNSAISQSMTTLVDVVAAEVRVAVGRDDLDDLLADLEDRDVEGAAAEVVDGDEVVLALVEAVGERRRGRLVDDALDVEAGDAAGVLGRLALGVVEVGRDGDDRLGDLLAEVVLGGALELDEDCAPRSPAAVSCLPRISTPASPLAPRTTLYGTRLISSPTSSNLRPMKRLIE